MAARPALPYPIGQMANLEADNSQSFSGMEQSHSISDVDRSLFGDRRRSSSAFVDYGRLTTWPELDHITPNSNQSNRGSFNLLSNLLEGASSRRSVSKNLLFIFDLVNNVLSDRSRVSQKTGKQRWIHSLPMVPQPLSQNLIQLQFRSRSSGSGFSRRGIPQEGGPGLFCNQKISPSA